MKNEITDEASLKQDIVNASARIDAKQKQIEIELLSLDEKIKTFTVSAWILVWLGLVISVVSVLYFLNKNNEAGFALNLLGDFLAGAVSSVWALAGLLFIYVAFLGQKQQLLNQQLEIMYSQLEVKYTRLELKGQKEEMIQQNNTLRIQQFENTFFNLITLHKTTITNARINATNKEQVGRFAFSHLWNEFKHSMMRHEDQMDLRRVANHFAEYCIKHDHVFGPYLSTVLNTLQLLDQLEVTNKLAYMRIYRAQLSHLDKIILFYAGAQGGERNILKPLIEKYHLLHLLDNQSLIDPAGWKVYDDSAFAD